MRQYVQTVFNPSSFCKIMKINQKVKRYSIDSSDNQLFELVSIFDLSLEQRFLKDIVSNHYLKGIISKELYLRRVERFKKRSFTF